MSLKIGNIDVITDERPSLKLLKALAVINGIHDEYAKQPWVKHADISKELCVLCALTVRDFLQRIGFKDARVHSVTAIVKASRGEELLHSLGVGTPIDHRVMYGKWAGHLVTTVDGFIIDTTLAQWKRPQWPVLPEMLAIQYTELTGREGPPLPGHLHPLALAHFDEADEVLIELAYLDRSSNRSWKDRSQGGDSDKRRRRAVVDALVKRFGPWRG